MKKDLGAEIKKYYLRDSADRDFRANGYEVILTAGERLEVDKATGEGLKKLYPYLELIKE